MNKRALSEADIRTKFITPALLGPNGGKWNVMTQIRGEAYFTKARVIVRRKTVKRGEARKADSRATAANLLSALVAELTGTPNNGKVSVPSASTTGRRGRPPKS